MPSKEENKDCPITSLGSEEREELWDDLYLKEEGVIVEFDPKSHTGKVKSVRDDSLYLIDGRELVKTRIELRPGDKVLFAPIEDPDGADYARVIRIIELNA